MFLPALGPWAQNPLLCGPLCEATGPLGAVLGFPRTKFISSYLLFLENFHTCQNKGAHAVNSCYPATLQQAAPCSVLLSCRVTWLLQDILLQIQDITFCLLKFQGLCLIDKDFF